MMVNLSAEQSAKIEAALKSLSVAAQELSNVLDETGYTLSKSAPDYMTDVDDFAYEIMSFVKDEVEELKSFTSLVHS